MKIKTRERVIKSPKEIKKLIDLINYYGLKVITIGKGGQYSTKNQMLNSGCKHNLSDYMIIELKDTQLQITTKYYEYKPTTYKFSLNNEELGNKSGISCFSQLNRMFRIPKAKDYDNKLLNQWFNNEQGKYVCSTSPIIGFNSKYNKQEIKDCYEYDLNSAYFSTLLKKIPDLNNPVFGDDIKVKPGYVGFNINEQLTMVENGYAQVVFPLIDAPKGLVDFCYKWYNIKKTSIKGSQERKDAKDMLNLPIGYCQRYNPFLRSYVIHKCNKVIRDLLDDDSLFWNTDAIFSKKRRPELEIGTEIGQFEEVHIDKLKYKDNVYQLDDDIPVYRGIPKAWFDNFNKVNNRRFDLLKDDLPPKANNYEWNWSTLTLQENTYETIN